MDTFIVIVTKYLFILLMLFYTWESFSALIHTKRYQAAGIFQRQNAIIFVTYILGIVTIFMNQKDTTDVNVIILGGLQMCFLIVVLGIFPIIYPNINKGILSNMCMLLTIGFIILARLSFEKSVKQFIIVAVVTMLSLIVPYLMSRFNMWKSLTWIYCFVGLGLLVAVLVVGTLSRGAKLYIKISGFTFQPSEFVKILFVFFVAASLQKSTDFKNVLITTAIAAAGMLSKSAEFGHLVLSAVLAGLYVIVLVISTDLGSALIFFMMYLFMVYVGTKKVRYLFIGMAGISTASVIAYKLFSHVQVRVLVWKNPFAADIINNSGYQVSQSLFALGSGGLMGTGLYQGYPNKIPIVDNDFVFSAIGEEFGAIFGILLILVCLSCFISFLNTAMEQNSMFNRLVCVGLGVGYAIQIILTVGGAINMIPSTGVTLPLISSGGSSILSTLIVFAIIQGLAIVGTANMNSVRRKVPTEGTGNVTTRTTSNVKGLRKTQEIQVGTKRKTKIK